MFLWINICMSDWNQPCYPGIHPDFMNFERGVKRHQKCKKISIAQYIIVYP